MGLLQVHYNDVVQGRALNGDIINVAQRVLSEQFPHVGGLQCTFYNSHPNFRCASGVQIHYTGNHHWITSSDIGSTKKCCARIFDSKWMGKLSSQTEIQVAQIYGGTSRASDTLCVEVVPVHQQNGVVDCGVFSVAFATDICHGLDPVAVSYDQRRMRDHLISCLEKKTFQPFPRSQTLVKLNARAFRSFKVYCSCRLPEHYDDKMIECEKCQDWYHYCCVGLRSGKKKQTRNWFCNFCQPKRQKK